MASAITKPGSSQIMLYTGPGTSPLCVDATDQVIQQLYHNGLHKLVRLPSLTDFLQLDPRHIQALVIPGGHAPSMYLNMREIREDLRAQLNKNSISYYGICAGGILASSNPSGRRLGSTVPSAEFMESPPDLLLSLALVPHSSFAPLFPPGPDAPSLKDYHLEQVSEPLQPPLYVPHVLGPCFSREPTPPDTTVEVLATYASLPPINLVKRHPLGMGFHSPTPIPEDSLAESLFYKPTTGSPAIITGCHREWTSKIVASAAFKTAFKASTKDQSTLVTQLEPHEAANLASVQQHLEKLGISCKKS